MQGPGMIKEMCRSRRIGGGKPGEGGEKARGEKVRMRRPMGSEKKYTESREYSTRGNQETSWELFYQVGKDRSVYDHYVLETRIGH
jgi:hypothetical protein